MIQIIFAYLVLMAIFFGGSYGLARMIPSALLNWIFVGIVILGVTLPCVASGQLAVFGLAMGASTFCGTKFGLKAGSVWQERK